MREAVQEVLGKRERLLGRIFPDIGSSLQPGPLLDHTWEVGGCFPFESRGWGLLPLTACCSSIENHCSVSPVRIGEWELPIPSSGAKSQWEPPKARELTGGPVGREGPLPFSATASKRILSSLRAEVPMAVRAL